MELCDAKTLSVSQDHYVLEKVTRLSPKRPCALYLIYEPALYMATITYEVNIVIWQDIKDIYGNYQIYVSNMPLQVISQTASCMVKIYAI